MREKRISVAGAEFGVRLPDRYANAIARNWVYRQVVKPMIDGPKGGRKRAAKAAPVLFPREISLPKNTARQKRIVNRVKDLEWYHTIELPEGVRTPGAFDHAPALTYIPLPADLAGKRCLDVATFDGYWAFEMERRGAEEVVAVDIATLDELDVPPWAWAVLRERGVTGPTGERFTVAAEALKSKVDRRIRNVYDLSSEEMGRFDVVYSGDLLVHITNPIHALQRIYDVTGGEAIIMEPYVPSFDALQRPVVRLAGVLEQVRWWEFSRSYLESIIRLAGFQHVEFCGSVDIRVTALPDATLPRAIFRAVRGPPSDAVPAAERATGE